MGSIWVLAWPRWVSAAAWMTLAAMVGGVIGWQNDAPFMGTWTGALIGLSAWLWGDTRRALRLVTWLRNDLSDSAPREGEVWGELAYRIERAARQRDHAIEAERNRLAQFLGGIEASPNGVVLLDAQEQIVWINRAASLHLGLHNSRDLGQRITNLVRVPVFVSHLQQAQQAQSQAQAQAIASAASGAEAEAGTQAAAEMPAFTFLSAPSRLMLSVIIRAYGQGQQLILTQDVTERLRAEAMRRDFVANVSHEIRTPLTVLSGFVETLIRLPLEEPDRRHVLQLMEQQTQRMQTLVSDLLTLAQLEGSPLPPDNQWVSVTHLLGVLGVEMTGLSQGRHTLSLPDKAVLELEGAEVAGQQSELLSLLTNLGSNAVRYTPKGGAITVTWSLREDGAGVFEVRDTGPGIAREHLPRLTERFYRVDGSRSRETGGTGLGLSIVKHVVQRHGAELVIESEPGQGSLFRVVLPAVRVRCRGAVKPSLSAVT